MFVQIYVEKALAGWFGGSVTKFRCCLPSHRASFTLAPRFLRFVDNVYWSFLISIRTNGHNNARWSRTLVIVVRILNPGSKVCRTCCQFVYEGDKRNVTPPSEP